MNKYTFPRVLLLIYAFAIPFQRLFYSTWFKYKFQLPEVIFIFLLIFSIFQFKQKLKLNLDVLPVFLFTIWALVSSCFHYSISSLLEGLGVLYLFIVGSITAWVVSTSDKDFLLWLIKSFVLGVVINCIASVLGLILLFNGIENNMGMKYFDYPLVGSVFRMQGFTSHPIMLSNLAICGFMLSLPVFEKYRRLILFLLLLGIGLSLTKSVLSGPAALLITYQDKIVGQRLYLRTFIWMFVIFLLMMKEYLTHFTIPNTDQQADKLSHALYWGGNIKIPVNDEYSIYNTVYYQLKQSSLQAFLENPITGVGGGNSNSYNLGKVKAGLLPETVKNFDPHSSVLGILAEFGIIGFVLFMLSLLSLIKILLRMLKAQKNKLIYALLAVIIFIIMESISADVVNYRHLWLVGGIIYGIYFSQERRNDPIYIPHRGPTWKKDVPGAQLL